MLQNCKTKAVRIFTVHYTYKGKKIIVWINLQDNWVFKMESDIRKSIIQAANETRNVWATPFCTLILKYYSGGHPHEVWTKYKVTVKQ